MSDTLADTANVTEAATVRVPSNLYSYIRASYDSREKVLDWCLAIAVVATLAYVFRDELRQMVYPDASPNAGRSDQPTPNQDVVEAFPYGGRVASDRIYTYNMPSSRAISYRKGPSATRPPADPSQPPSFDAEDQQS